MKNTLPTHYVRALEKDSDGNVVRELRFYHTPGARTYLILSEGMIHPDSITTDPEGKIADLLFTVNECWIPMGNIEVQSVDLNYR